MRDTPLRMGYLKSPSPNPAAYRRGSGQFAGKPLAMGECDFTQAWLRWRRWWADLPGKCDRPVNVELDESIGKYREINDVN
jgi:hypothetical protein